MKKFISMLACAAMMIGMVACEKSEDGNGLEVNPADANGLLVLNNGSIGKNNATVSVYDFASKEVVEDAFSAANNKIMGDTAQDVAVIGDKVYIAMYGSGFIYVTDLNQKVIKTIGNPSYSKPRSFTVKDDILYVSYYDGGVAKIDTKTMAVKNCAAGLNAEELEVVGNKVYVAVSEGMQSAFGTTVEVFSADYLVKTKTITVGMNPQFMDQDSKGDLYLITGGNYFTVSPSLQKISTADDSVTTLAPDFGNDAFTPANMAMGENDQLYMIAGGYDEYWAYSGDVFVYDTKSGETKKFITDGTEISNISRISTNRKTNEVFITASDYVNNGDVYVFGIDGKLKYKFVAGINPMKVVYTKF